ncbi:MAG TPA: hypothetical protein VLD58_11200 [Gemmatimonadales bacterium]|nr:hypothetical protein [Gemmatimonadales bacterium]
MNRRIAIVEIEHTMFGLLMRGRRDAALTSDWPDDATIVGGEYNLDRGVVRLLVESAMFDEVPPGHMVPQWTPVLTAHVVEPPAAALIDLIEKMQEGD